MVDYDSYMPYILGFYLLCAFLFTLIIIGIDGKFRISFLK